MPVDLLSPGIEALWLAPLNKQKQLRLNSNLGWPMFRRTFWAKDFSRCKEHCLHIYKTVTYPGMGLQPPLIRDLVICAVKAQDPKYKED